MTEEKKPILDFSEREYVKDFIHKTPSGLYEGLDVDGRRVIVTLEKGKGMDVETLQANGWWMCHEYDEDGWMCGESFNKERKDKDKDKK